MSTRLEDRERELRRKLRLTKARKRALGEDLPLSIENRAGRVKLDERVDKSTADKLIEEIAKLFGDKAVFENLRIGEVYAKAEDALETLDIEIHSPGGHVFDGWRMYQALCEMRDRGVYVTATINSLAASMASVVAMAADEVRIVRGGKMMIHEASSLTFGTAQDHRSAADNLEEISETIAGVYAERTGKPAAEMRGLMRAETWIGAERAVKMGLADRLVSGGIKPTPKRKPAALARPAASSTRPAPKPVGVWERYEAIKSPSGRSRFWKDNRRALLAAMRTSNHKHS